MRRAEDSAYIIVRTLPLPCDFDCGEVVTLVEQGKEFCMRLVRDALAGDREIWVIPMAEVVNRRDQGRVIS